MESVRPPWGPDGAAPLDALVSTCSHSKHGHRDTHTEVPGECLLAELRRHSTLRSTQELETSGTLVLTLTFDL